MFFRVFGGELMEVYCYVYCSDGFVLVVRFVFRGGFGGF